MKKYLLFLFFLSSVAFATQSGTVDLGPTIGGGGGGGSGTVTEVDTGDGLTGGPITTSGTISCLTSSASVLGCLSSTDWSTFNSKANSDLSNLTNPTALNQDLIFQEGTNAQILTGDSSSGPTANLNMKTGDGTGQASGSFSIGAGDSDTQSGGNVEFSSGNVTTATTNESSGGQISIFGGNTASTNVNSEGGSVSIYAGSAPIAANAGGVSIYEGNQAAGINIGHNVGVNILDDAGIQGAIFFSTDRELDDATGSPIINFTTTVNLFQNLIFSQSSSAVVQTADNSSGTGSLPLTVEAGNDTSTSGTEGGGNLILEAGSTTSATNAGIGGNILMNAGNAAGSGGDTAGGGNVTVKAGSSTTPLSSGSVTIQDGNALSSVTVAPGGLSMTDDSGGSVFAASSASGLILRASTANKTVTVEDGNGNAVLDLAGDFSLSNTAGTIFNSFNNDAKIDMDGQLYMSAYPTAPTISGCGSGAALSAVDPSDATGAITMGTGVTSCVLTFANAWVGQVHCFLNDETTTIATAAVPTLTQVTLKGAFLTGDVVDYWCVGEF